MNRIPRIATGQVVPSFHNIQQAKEDEKERKQRKHDWRIAIFSVIGGGLMGLLASFIFWLCTK